MIQKIIVTNTLGDTLDIGLFSDGDERYVLINPDGLGSLRANINTLGGPRDGAVFNSSKLQKRTATLTIAVNPNVLDVEAARQSLNRFFNVKNQVTVTVVGDNRTSHAVGYVEGLNLNLTARVENAEITVVFPIPYWIETEDTVTVLSGVTPMFEFPFSNESLTEPLIIFSEETDHVSIDIDYQGDYPTGIVVVFDIQMNGAWPAVFYNTTHKERIDINDSVLVMLTGGLAEGDILVLDTRVGQKSFTHHRGGVETNVINALGYIPDWITLRPGINNFVYEVGTDIKDVDVYITHNSLFGGF